MQFARKHASEFGAKADWSREGLPEEPRLKDWEAWLQEHPDSYWGLRATAEAYFVAEQFEKAKLALERLRDLETLTGERGGPLELLAQVYRKLGDTKAERIVLEQTVANSSDALPSLRRLIDLALEDGEWDAVQECAANVIAINPMLAEGQSALAEAAEHQEGFPEAVRALQALACMDPVDPAAIDFRMARALKNMGSLEEAKHHVLRALLEAPRFREAQTLLLELSEQDAPSENDADTDEPGAAKEESANSTTATNAETIVRENSGRPPAADAAPKKDDALKNESVPEGEARQGDQNLSSEFDSYGGKPQ